MPSISPSQNLAFWFTNLRQFQTATNNTSAIKMTLLTFANSPITPILPSTTEQDTFIVSVGASTGYTDMNNTDLTTTYKSFEALLDHWNPLPTATAIVLQSLAVPALQGTAGADFLSALVSDAFPGGSTGADWTTALGVLTSSIPAVCFTATLQTAVNKTVDTATSKMSDLISQIAVLG